MKNIKFPKTRSIGALALTLFATSSYADVTVPNFFSTASGARQPYEVPHDAPTVPVISGTTNIDYATEQEQLAIFAWQEFIAVNWPSNYASASLRGTPDTTKDVGNFLQPDNAGDLVWQTFMHRVEVFPGGAGDLSNPSSVTYPGYPARTFDTAPSYVYVDEDTDTNIGTKTDIPQCGVYDSTQGTWATLPNTSLDDVTLFNNLDETTQINLATLFVSADPSDPGIVDGQTPSQAAVPGPNATLADSLQGQPRRFIYEAKANRVLFDHVNSNTYWKDDVRTDAQRAAYVSVREQGGGGTQMCPTTAVSFGTGEEAGSAVPLCYPHGGNAAGSEGAMLVKATWRQLTVAEYNSGRFLTAPIVRYRSTGLGENMCFETVTPPAEGTELTTSDPLPYGLTGLHIIHKTENYPTYVFATFEQVDNLSGANYSDLFYYNRNNQGPTSGNRQNVTSRAHPIPSPVDDVNDQAHLQVRQQLASLGLTDSTWLYYKLVGVQGSPAYPQNTSEVDYFLANITTETNEVLRSFSGILNNATGTIDPQVINLFHGSDSFVMGGCKGCHGNAQVGPAQLSGEAPADQTTLKASDFSFITQNAPITEPDAINQPLIKTFTD